MIKSTSFNSLVSLVLIYCLVPSCYIGDPFSWPSTIAEGRQEIVYLLGKIAAGFFKKVGGVLVVWPFPELLCATNYKTMASDSSQLPLTAPNGIGLCLESLYQQLVGCCNKEMLKHIYIYVDLVPPPSFK